MENRYPEYIMCMLRQRFCSKETDKSNDDVLNSLTPNEVFEEVCNFEGLVRYAYIIKKWVNDIYNVDLDELSMDCEE